jgi:hypothetical protein
MANDHKVTIRQGVDDGFEAARGTAPWLAQCACGFTDARTSRERALRSKAEHLQSVGEAEPVAFVADSHEQKSNVPPPPGAAPAAAPKPKPAAAKETL